MLILFISCIAESNKQAIAKPLGRIENSWGGYCGFSSLPAGSGRQVGGDFSRKLRNETDIKRMIERLARDIIFIRLNIVHDKALEEEHRNNRNGLLGFIRDFVYTTQLIYEQPELSSHLKINLVVVSVQLSSLRIDPGIDSNKLLHQFSNSPETTGVNRERADLHVLLLYRALSSGNSAKIEEPERRKRIKLAGLAEWATFCNAQRGSARAMVISADSFGAAPVFAHEMAHALNVLHDNDPNGFHERHCKTSDYLMGPISGPDKLIWSECTLHSLIRYFTFLDIHGCIYDQKRIDSAKPMLDMFDLNPLNAKGKENRRRLPGELVPLDEQCARHFGRTSRSVQMTFNYQSGDYTTCQMLVCFIGGRRHIAFMGPAPPGSVCNNRGSNKLGRCFNTRCQVGEGRQQQVDRTEFKSDLWHGQPLELSAIKNVQSLK